MECCEGRELYEELQEINKFPEVQAAKIIKQVLQAITHLHGMNIVHRDIKPENMLVQKIKESYELKLIDFGFSKPLEENRQKLNSKVGTPFFISP